MDERQGAAEYLLNDNLLNNIFDEIEAGALENCVNAKPSDDELRRTSTQEVRAIRAVRRQLQTLAKGPTKPTPRRPVA